MNLDLSLSSTIEGRVGKNYKNGEEKEEGYKRLKNGEDSEGDYIDENGKRRAKRRSKNDLDGRDYKCSYCPKTYLSYPALYTHMKTKHSNGSDSQQLLLNSGRGRGRPKKNAGRVTTIAPDSEEYFKTLDKGGGPTDPLFYLENVIEEFFSENSSTNQTKFALKTERKEVISDKEGKGEESKVKEEVNTIVKTEDMNKPVEEQQKMSNDQNLPETKIDNPKQKNEEGKSEFKIMQTNFKQFDFKIYKDFKTYPLYNILNKKKLFAYGDGKELVEVKEEPIEVIVSDPHELKDVEMEDSGGNQLEMKEVKVEE